MPTFTAASKPKKPKWNVIWMKQPCEWDARIAGKFNRESWKSAT